MDIQTVLTNFITAYANDLNGLESSKGELTDLSTGDKASIVNAINGLYRNISTLPTQLIGNGIYSSEAIIELIKAVENNIVGDLVNTLIDVFDQNLIQNGDAEAIVGSTSGSGNVYAPPKWTCTGSVLTVKYDNNIADMPKSTSTGPVNRGDNFFAGGDSFADATMIQTVNVGKGYKDIDAGRVTFKLSGYLGGKLSKNDSPIISLEFIDYFSNVLAVKLGPVTAFERNYTTGLLYRELTGNVPQGTRYIRVTVLFRRYSGNYNDAYLDNLSLVFTGGTNQSTSIGPINYSELSLNALRLRMEAIRLAISQIHDDTAVSFLPQTLTDDQQHMARINIGISDPVNPFPDLVTTYLAAKPVIVADKTPYLVISRYVDTGYVVSILNATTGEFTDITDLCGNRFPYNDFDDPYYMPVVLYSDRVRYLSLDYWNSIITAYDDNLAAFTPVWQDRLNTALDPSASRNRSFIHHPNITLYMGKYYFTSVYLDSGGYYMNLITFDESNQADPIIAQSETVVNNTYDVNQFMSTSPAFVSLYSRFIIYKDQVILMGSVGIPYASIMPEQQVPKTVFRTPPNKTDVENKSPWHTVTYDGVFFVSGKELNGYLYLEGWSYDESNGRAYIGGLYRASQYTPGQSITIEQCTVPGLTVYTVAINKMLFDGTRYIHPDTDNSSADGIYAWVSTDGLNFTRELIVNPTEVTLLPVIPGTPGTGGGKGGSTMPTPDIIRTYFQFMTYRDGKYVINLQFGIFSSSSYNTGWTLIPNCYNDVTDLIDGPFVKLINSYSK